MRWAHLHGWRCLLEVPLPCLKGIDERRPDRQGVVDILISGRGGLPDLVIELDRADKRWSARKLAAAAADGMTAIWVRWGGRYPSRVPLPPSVTLIQIKIPYRRRRLSSEQLTLFSSG